MQGEQCNAVLDPIDDIVTAFGQDEKKEGVVYAKHSLTHTHTDTCPQINFISVTK